MGGCDQSCEKIKFKRFKKYESSPKSLPNNKNDDTCHSHFAIECTLHTGDKDPYTQWAHGEYIVGTDNT